MALTPQLKNGILKLGFVLIFLSLLFYLRNYFPRYSAQFVLNEKVQNQLDQQKLIYESKLNTISKSYYVNSITDYSGYQLELSSKQINALLDYYTSGKLIYNLKELQKVIQADSLQMILLKNKLRFPKKNKFSEKHIKISAAKVKKKKKFFLNKKYDINLITAIQLEKEFKLPAFIAKRIIKYRKYLKGFDTINQVEKVYDILPYQIVRIKKYCYIKKG